MVGAIASGKRREPSGRSIRAITPRRICRLKTPNCWFDGFQGGGEGEAYLRQLRRSAALARDRVVFRGAIFETAVLEGEFRAARILLIHRWPRAAKLLVSRRSKP